MFRPVLASIVSVALPALMVAACSGPETPESPGAPASGGVGVGGTASGGHSAAGSVGAAAAGGALGRAGGGSAAGGGGSGAGGSPSSSGGTSSGGMAGGGAAAGAGAAGMSVAGAPAAAGAGGSGGSSPAQGGTSAGGSGAGSPQQPVSCEPVPAGQQLAFPGAEGFGRFSKGGRGGSVCHVTTLADSGPGSFRDCVSQGNRTVVFQVGGWITLTGNLGITASNITIAGQTAPGGGIGIRGTKLSIGGSNIIMRFFRVRRGIITTSDRNDAMTVSSKASNVIIDHCSVGFGTDENLSMPGDEGIGPRDFTLQWSVVAWGLQRNNHSAGSLLTASNTTIHHSVYAFNGTRNPKARSEEGRTLDFVNNVIYGWNAPDPVGEAQGWGISQHPFLMADTANGMHYANAVGNYFISYGKRTATQAFSSGATNAAGAPTYNLYFDGNLLDGNANGVLDVSKNDWSMVGTATRLPARIAAPRVCTDDAPTAFNKVMAHVGASLTVRDEVDDALVKAIKAQGGVKIHDETELGVGAQGFGALAAGTAPVDSDKDGMSDAWETQHGLSPTNVSDGNADADADGYTNLEEYLNELAAPAFVF